MKIRTRAFLLGLLPTLLVATVLTAFHIRAQLNELDTKVTQQGLALARHLASAAEYGVISGNEDVLQKLLAQAVEEPGVRSAAVAWPEQRWLVRGEPLGAIRPALWRPQQEIGKRSWFVHPVYLSQLEEDDSFGEQTPANTGPLAWVAVSLDLEQKRDLAQQLLLASLGITLIGVALSTLLIYRLALTGVKPLLDIIATVKRISSGGFGSRMEVTARSPELRELQASVNHMSESLRSYQQDMEARVSDVTAELENKTREAEHANLAKSRFLAAASHDLRQPMYAISLYVESLKLQMHGRAAEDTLARIERSIAGMVELFNAILDVTKLDAGVVHPDIAPVHIRGLMLHLGGEFAAEAEYKGISLRVRAPDVWIESDAILLERILRNLLSNAVRYTERGGVLLSARRRRDTIRLQIWDTGSGIATEHQATVFDEFYQVGRQSRAGHAGLGLGLAIVRRLAKLLGHPLQLHSRPGRGTVFSLDVPLRTALLGVEEDDHGEAGPTLSGNVLLVDDDPAILNALTHLLRQWGMNVTGVCTLEQARRDVQSRPDVVLADYQLLNGDTGVMVSEAVRRRWGQDVPVAIITGDTRTETIRNLREYGLPVLHKPVRTQQLRDLLRQWL